MDGPVDLPGWARRPFEAAGITRDVFRCGRGPAVLVLSEIPGITPKVEAFGRRIVERGCAVAMPQLFGTPGRSSSGAYAIRSLAETWLSRQFAGLALGRTGPIVHWLRALAAAEYARAGGPGIGVVGMCYTGGFGLAMAVDPIVVAPVLSQPSLPFAVGTRRRQDLQVSPEAWSELRRRSEDDGLCVLGLRFTGDRAVPGERFTRLRAELGDRFIGVELDSSPGNPYGHRRAAHSVLTEDLDDRPGTPTRQAMDRVLAFLADRLLAS